MSRSCPRVMSPSPARSTLITSAPIQARSCVHVGPDCTWVKSSILTPSSALLITFPLYLSVVPNALLGRVLPLRFLLRGRIEARDAAAFRAGLLVDDRVD